MGFDALLSAAHFARTRWALPLHDREALLALQQQGLQRFMREVLPRAPAWRAHLGRPLDELPTMDKAAMMAAFEAHNTRGIALAPAMAIALRAEIERDFSPTLGDLTVGLSSGTSGNRGLFLVSRAERQRWAGILLARALPQALLKRLLTPWRPALRIAFFLRANSNLYTTLNSRRIHFNFFDLLLGVAPALARLNADPPDVLVGPPSLLRALAAEQRAGRLVIRPHHVISVAEVLEAGDDHAVQDTFGVAPHQLYQATEGFLGYSCEHGTLHLNEAFVHIEPEWLDAARTRFQPVITDFTRETQLMVRYRLSDVLRVRHTPCACGRAERAIEAIEGRADELLWLPACHGGAAVAIFPDRLRRAMLLAGPSVREFDVCQHGMVVNIGLLHEGHRQDAEARVAAELNTLWRELGVRAPQLVFGDWSAPAPGAKRRRVRRASLPEGLICTF